MLAAKFIVYLGTKGDYYKLKNAHRKENGKIMDQLSRNEVERKLGIYQVTASHGFINIVRMHFER